MKKSDFALVRRAVIEARIIKWFNSHPEKVVAPSRLLSSLARPKRGIKLSLTRNERIEFTELIRRIQRARKTINFYREKYSRRPKFFYSKVFGFPPRKSQSVRIIWGTLNIHFVFSKNEISWLRAGLPRFLGGLQP